ncbi:hypothetical protein AOLI_G00285370 [Acnodon oligacanthus]
MGEVHGDFSAPSSLSASRQRRQARRKAGLCGSFEAQNVSENGNYSLFWDRTDRVVILCQPKCRAIGHVK